MNRYDLEEAAWKLPRIQNSGLDFSDLEAMSDSELRALLGLEKPSTRPKKEKPKREPVKRHPGPRCVSFEYVERDGQLKRLERWQYSSAGHSWFEEVIAPVGKQIQWEGRRVSASLVLHWLRTGQMLKRAPRVNVKPYRAVVRAGGKTVHLGYFATAEERDQTVALAKLGIYPNGAKKT